MDKGKRYRPNVAAIILSPSYPLECKVFIAQRHDISGAWQFPQGGIDEGESPKEALFRELEEEIRKQLGGIGYEYFGYWRINGSRGPYSRK